MATWANFLQNLGSAIGEGLQDIGTHTARAAAQANEVSRQAQSAQAAFNAESANVANSITDNRIAGQYGYNTAMMAAANQFNQESWDRTAAWNERMWERQAEFNAQQAQIQRDWQEQMSNTQYQRAMTDMQKAGLNPILAYSQGGAGIPGGATASVGGASMSSASSAMASGGLVGADSASIGNYTGQMEYMSGILGLVSALIGGISTATQAASGLPEGTNIIKEILMPGSYETKEGEHVAGKAENTWDGIERYWNKVTGMIKDDKEYRTYIKNGGKMSYEAWEVNKRLSKKK